MDKDQTGKEKGSMVRHYSFGNKSYAVGKRKSTGLYAIWEFHHRKGFTIIFECADFEDLKTRLIHLRDLATKRETRQMIADICGTSYAAAKRDMGL
jgi:hypothetical protein